MKQRVVKKDEVTKVLFEGGKIHKSHWDAKVTLLEFDKRTNQYVELGTVRFDTYLQLDLREVNMKLPLIDNDNELNVECSPFEQLRRPDAWCGYDEYQLKSKVLELYKQDTEFARYFKKRIWKG